jgi:hypothetical protein
MLRTADNNLTVKIEVTENQSRSTSASFVNNPKNSVA